MKVHAIVPVQDFARAKSRLASVLDAAARARLAESLATHVVTVLRAHAGIDEVVVATPSRDVHTWARARGLTSVLDAPSAVGLAAVIDGARALVASAPTIVVMSDLPKLGSADVDALIVGLADAEVVIAPDAKGRGTNGLGLSVAMPTCFGHEDSALRHRARAAELGLRAVLVEREGLAFDVDHPEDLARLNRRID